MGHGASDTSSQTDAQDVGTLSPVAVTQLIVSIDGLAQVSRLNFSLRLDVGGLLLCVEPWLGLPFQLNGATIYIISCVSNPGEDHPSSGHGLESVPRLGLPSPLRLPWLGISFQRTYSGFLVRISFRRPKNTRI